jgi:hypothetical protein
LCPNLSFLVHKKYHKNDEGSDSENGEQDGKSETGEQDENSAEYEVFDTEAVEDDMPLET